MTSRRAVLRGIGAALALPWLQSLRAPGAQAQAQAGARRPRFIPIFLPNGAPELWKPQTTGPGAALSAVLERLAPVKSKTIVISGLENGSVFNLDGGSSVEPAHPRLAGAWLTCVDADSLRGGQGNLVDVNGISVDQVIAAHPRYAQTTPLPSLQVGLTSVQASCDGKPCSLSRSISWRTPQEPLNKLVDPKQVFNLLTGQPLNAPLTDSSDNLSILDTVQESAGTLRGKLSAADQLRLDEYLDSVRELEMRIGEAKQRYPLAPFTFPDLSAGQQFRSNLDGYDKGRHADLMNDLIAMALATDQTRVVSYMLEDQRSEFNYDNVPRRVFTATASSPSTGFCGNYAGAQRGSQDEYASITWWNVNKVAELCQKLDQLDDGEGQTVLDNSVVLLGSCMHGSNHAANELPTLLVGGGGGVLATDQHLDTGKRPLRDLYFTLMNSVFGLGVADFGSNRSGAPIATISGLLR